MIATMRRLAAFYYTASGKKASEQVWEETLEELRFARVKDILALM